MFDSGEIYFLLPDLRPHVTNARRLQPMRDALPHPTGSALFPLQPIKGVLLLETENHPLLEKQKQSHPLEGLPRKEKALCHPEGKLAARQENMNAPLREKGPGPRQSDRVTPPEDFPTPREEKDPRLPEEDQGPPERGIMGHPDAGRTLVLPGDLVPRGNLAHVTADLVPEAADAPCRPDDAIPDLPGGAKVFLEIALKIS